MTPEMFFFSFSQSSDTRSECLGLLLIPLSVQPQLEQTAPFFQICLPVLLVVFFLFRSSFVSDAILTHTRPESRTSPFGYARPVIGRCGGWSSTKPDYDSSTSLLAELERMLRELFFNVAENATWRKTTLGRWPQILFDRFHDRRSRDPSTKYLDSDPRRSLFSRTRFDSLFRKVVFPHLLEKLEKEVEIDRNRRFGVQVPCSFLDEPSQRRKVRSFRCSRF